MRRAVLILIGLVLICMAVFLAFSFPYVEPAQDYAGLTGDAARGKEIFAIAGCANCHAAPNATAEAELILSGGKAFTSDFGTFYAPNISPDLKAGIGNWSVADLGHALRSGVDNKGRHLYPVLPYASYQHLGPQDIADLKAFLDILPPSDQASRAHDVGLPFSIRRGIGLWKTLFLSKEWVLATADTPQLERGRMLVEGLAHCGECHTPRNLLGAPDRNRWLGGAPNPVGKGTIPNITPGALDWSEDQIATYLTTGFTPDFDSAGGEMVHVIDNLAQLPQSDIRAIVAYLKAIPAVPR